MKRLLCAIMVVVMSLGLVMPVIASTPTHFTYTYNQRGVPTPSPDAYTVSAFMLGNDFGVGHFLTPRGLFVFENLLYVVDSGNNRIVVIQVNEDGTHDLYDVRDYAMLNGVPSSFRNPHGIFVSDWGEIYLADTDNQRILHMDADWNVINEITQPEESLQAGDADFLPENLVVDFTRRIFVQVRHVNRGLMEFDRYGNFAVYMGAAPVTVSLWDQLWRRIQTQEQRDRTSPFIPTEYNNVVLDHEGFLFVTNTSDDVHSVRRLNAMGNDVLIRNGRFAIEGDISYGDVPMITGPSQFIAVAPIYNNTFMAFDFTRGRIFAYDFQGNLLYAFGGVGNRQGFFVEPVDLVAMGTTLFALDVRTGAITRFDLTEYGRAINRGLYYYRRGLYQESSYYWHEVLRMNGNFYLAYVGLGRAMLRQGNYRQAMRYFRIADEPGGYGRAFGFYRRIWMEENFWMFVVAIGVLIIVPPTVKKVIKVRKEILAS